MKRLALLATFAAVIAIGGTASARQQGNNPVPGLAQLTVVDASTYDYPGSPFTHTLCIDGSVASSAFSAGDQVGPDAIAAGPHTVSVINGNNASCNGQPDATTNVDLAAGDDVTVVFVWTQQDQFLISFDNDTGCVAPGNARVRAVHGAGVGPVDIYASAAGDPPAAPALFASVAAGTVTDSAEVPAGTYDLNVFAAGDDPGTDAPLITVSNVSLAEGANAVFYAAGGVDGDAGVFAKTSTVDVCEVATTTTTTSTTTTTEVQTAPAGATPVPATPSYTG